jgi:hypothetical protein
MTNAMTVDDALKIVDAALLPKRLNTVQEVVFRLSWQGKSFSEIAEESRYDAAYVRDVGYKLWHLLSKAFGERVTKSNLNVVIRQYRSMESEVEQVQERSNVTRLNAGNGVSKLLAANGSFYTQYDSGVAGNNTSDRNDDETSNIIDFKQPLPSSRRDWGNAIDTSIFYGRERELELLSSWIVGDDAHKSCCRLLGVFGMGGIGKTAFAIKLAEQVEAKFECVIWRSLHNAPAVEDILTDLIGFLSEQQVPHIPVALEGKISLLIAYLRKQKCLLILDNFESVLQSGETAGQYREGYEGYGEMLRLVSEVSHQSCLMITSREKPQEHSPEGDSLFVRSLQLTGLQDEAQAIFAQGIAGSEAGTKLIAYYRGNPLALQVVSRSVQDLFDGNIDGFVEQGTAVFSRIRHILDQQCDRLSTLELQIMFWLSIDREPVTLDDLFVDIVPMPNKNLLFEALTSLNWRSLIERNGMVYTLQPMVMEYMTNRLIEQAYTAIINEQMDFLFGYALIKLQSSEHVRETQSQSILKPLVAKLIASYGSKERFNDQLSQLLKRWREYNTNQGYCAHNILNLLKQSEQN